MAFHRFLPVCYFGRAVEIRRYSAKMARTASVERETDEVAATGESRFAALIENNEYQVGVLLFHQNANFFLRFAARRKLTLEQGTG